MSRFNQYHQEIGYAVDNWVPREAPKRITLKGEYCNLEPLNSENHAVELYDAFKENDTLWTYLPIGPFRDFPSFKEIIDKFSKSKEAVHFAIVNLTSGCAVGTLCLHRVDRENGSIEVGYVVYSPELKKTCMATEAQYLLMRYVFDHLRYRRYEWRCDNLNGPSRAAATRLGFKFEGVFRQITVYKGRNRDTAWFSIIDQEWRCCRQTLEKWLSKENFQDGRQKSSLAEIRKICEAA